MKVEVAVLGSPSLIVHTVSVDVKQYLKKKRHSELRSYVKVEVAVLGSPSLIVHTVSAVRKATLKCTETFVKAQSCVKVEVAVLYIVIALWSLWT